MLLLRDGTVCTEQAEMTGQVVHDRGRAHEPREERKGEAKSKERRGRQAAIDTTTMAAADPSRCPREKVLVFEAETEGGLGTETVEGSTLSLEGVDDVEGGDGLALRVLGVGDRVSDDV
jgi:hypothetical protein